MSALSRRYAPGTGGTPVSRERRRPQRPSVKRHTRLAGDLLERVDFRRREQQPAELLAARGGLRLGLAREHALFITVAEDVAQHGLHVFILRPAKREFAGERFGPDALEEECRRAFFVLRAGAPAAAQGR